MPTLTIKAQSTAQAYWIAVDDQDVEMTNDQGQVQVAAGEHHLFWWIMGVAGNTLAITVDNGPTRVATVKGSKIPAGRSRGGGVKPFQV
jgi:hypothetical protein